MLHSGVSSVLSAWGVRSKSTSRSLPGAALGFSLHHIPFGSLSSSLEWPSLGKKQSFSIPAVTPRATRGFWAPNTGELAPLYPSCFWPPSPALGPQPGRAGAHPGQGSPSVPQSHPLRPARGRSSAPRAHGSRGQGRHGETTESAGRSPGPSPSGAGDSSAAGADGRGRPNSRAERGRRDSTHLCLAGARGPSGARPFSGGPAPPGGPFS